MVKPETVIRWHRRGFRADWRWKSRKRGGRPRIDGEICHHPADEQGEPAAGSAAVRGELLVLGIEVAESTLSRYMAKRQGPIINTSGIRF